MGKYGIINALKICNIIIALKTGTYEQKKRSDNWKLLNKQIWIYSDILYCIINDILAGAFKC